MEPFQPRLSFNPYSPKFDDEKNLRTWPLRAKEEADLPIFDTPWPEIEKKEKVKSLGRSFTPKLKRRFKNVNFSDFQVNFSSLENKNKVERGGVMEPDVSNVHGGLVNIHKEPKRSSSRSPKVPRKKAEGESSEEIEKSEKDESVQGVAQPVLKRNNTPEEVRQELKRNFSTGELLKSISEATSTSSKIVHTLRETASTHEPIRGATPLNVFDTLTRPTSWDASVEPSFDEISFKKKRDQNNLAITTLCPLKGMDETRAEYFLRLVRELYKLQGSQMRRKQIQEQLDKLRTYEIPTTNLRGNNVIDHDRMVHDLSEIPCFEVLQRLTPRGFALGMYAANKLWPKLFPQEEDVVKKKNKVKKDGETRYYFRGTKICAQAKIRLKQGGALTVCQIRLFEFCVQFFSRLKIHRDHRVKSKYQIGVTEVPIGSLMLSLKSKNRDPGEKFYDYSLSMIKVNPLDISELKKFKDKNGKRMYAKSDLKEAKKLQEVWIEKTKQYNDLGVKWPCGIELENRTVLYPGQMDTPYDLHE